MRIIQPDLLGHFDSKGTRLSVYSLDFQPNGGRLATGAGDGTVKIWNGDGLLSMKASTQNTGSSIDKTTNNNTSATPAITPTVLLTTLTSHAKSVNCVRWSKDGYYLASGSDDNYIIIHRHTPGGISNQTFGMSSSSTTQKNIEVWNTCFTLQGHSMNVLDLDWSVKGILASASIDNKILLWDIPSQQQGDATGNGSSASASRILSPMQVLQGHTSFVKGISFDPIGRYLISTGSDNLVLVWDSENKYSLLQSLSQPLKQSTDVAKFKRLSWSPDGNSVCITTASKSGKPVGMVLKRGDWSDVADLVGHTVSTSTARFCPYLLSSSSSSSSSTSESNSNGSAAMSLVALGDQNGTLTIWSTQRERPLFALKSLFSEAITDISWMYFREKIVLSISSITGDVIVMDLQGDCGKVLNDESLTRHFRSLYGKGLKELHSRSDGLVSDPLLLKYSNLNQTQNQSQSSANGITTSTPSSGASNGGMSVRSIPVQPIPQVVPPSNAGNVVPTSAALSSASQPSSSSSSSSLQKTLQQQIVTNKNGKKRIRPVLMNVETNEPMVEDDMSMMAFDPQPPMNDITTITAQSSINNSTVVDKDGKKRIRFHDSEGGGVTSTGFGNNAITTPSSSSQVRRNDLVSAASSSNNISMRGNNFAPTTVVQQQVLTVKFSANEVLFQIPLPPSLPHASQGNGVGGGGGNKAYEIVKVLASVYKGKSRTGNGSSTSGTHRHVVRVERMSMPTNLYNLSKHGTALSRVVLLNELLGRGGDVEQKEVWSTVVSGEVIAVSGVVFEHTSDSKDDESLLNSQDHRPGVVMLGCVDGSIHLLETSSGMRLLAPMVLGASIVFVDTILVDTACCTLRLLSLTGEGQVFVWQMDINHSSDITTVANSSLKKVMKTEIKPLLLSMRLRDRPSTAASTSVASVAVDRCYLHSSSHCPIVSLCSVGALGGDYQSFQFNPMTDCWQRIADSRHFLSSLFAAHAPVASPSSSTSDSLATLHQQAAQQSGITNRDLLAVSRAKASIANVAGLDANSASSSTSTISAIQWTDMVTMSHAEERLSTAIALGVDRDIERAISDWVSVCCQHSQQSKIEKVIFEITNSLSDRSVSASQHLVSWMCSQRKPLQVVERVILPAISKESLSNPNNQSLLADVVQLVQGLLA